MPTLPTRPLERDMAAMATSAAAAKLYAYIDFDVGSRRERLSRAASFIFATDTRYGFSSKDMRTLGGSELQVR